MKINKFTAIGASVAIVVGSVLGIGLAASAVEVPIDEIGTEGATYPVEQWFVGNTATNPGGFPTQDENGLTIVGRNQLLYGRSISNVTGAQFTAFIDGASFVASNPMTFQVPVFFDGTANTQFTTLRPDYSGSPEGGVTSWISSQAVAGLPAETAVPFATIVAAFETAGDAEILAFGVQIQEPATTVLSSVTWGGETWTFATPTEAVVPPAIEEPAPFTG